MVGRNNKRGFAFLSGAVVVVTVALAGCATGMKKQEQEALVASMAKGDYKAAVAHIESQHADGKAVYSAKNEVLYRLDLGLVQHEAGQFADSDANFAIAEDRIEELFTKSASREAGTLLVNDATTEFSGERFERVMLNTYRSLDYLGQGDRSGAMVEIRKLSRLLQEYHDTLTDTAYSDDAFAQYLGSLLYADNGQKDDSRISMQAAQKAYASYQKNFGTVPPQSFETVVPTGSAEIVFIHANGVVPRKASRTVQVAWGDAVATLNASNDGDEDTNTARNAARAGMLGNAITVAFPVFESSKFRIAASTVTVQRVGKTVSAATSVVEDIDKIAKQDLKERMRWIAPRAIARATTKYILTKTAADQAKKQGGELAGLFASLVGNAAASASEVADTRSWTTLPAQFRLARVVVPVGDAEGEQDVAVQYLDAAGQPVMTRHYTAMLKKGRRVYLYDRTAL